ncbi:MAG: response regulator, partial [Desulfobulbaceae bacterium]|nr:response regulator [Desulfobulbaceae bacterium]
MSEDQPNKTILVVEDEGIIAMDISSTLQALGYNTPPSINNGAEAITVAGDLHPDLILIDILLKGDIDGIEAAVAIKEKYNIPIVYLTANTDEQTFQRAKVSGPFGYLLKPFEERELHSTIETALFKHQTEQKLQLYRDHLEELVQNRTAELEKTHAALQQSEANYRAIFHNANDAIFVIDADGRILDANPGASLLTGYSCEEIKGMTLNQLGEAEQTLSPEETMELMQKALAGTPQIFEWLTKNKTAEP